MLAHFSTYVRYQVVGFGVTGFNFLFLLMSWVCLRMEWGCILCTCAPLMLVQPAYLLWCAAAHARHTGNPTHTRSTGAGHAARPPRPTLGLCACRYAMYELYLTESCGRQLMDDDVCPEWNLTNTALENCVHCGFKDWVLEGNYNLSEAAPPGEAYKCLVNCGINNVEVCRRSATALQPEAATLCGGGYNPTLPEAATPRYRRLQPHVLQVGSLVSGVYEVLIYNQKYAAVWEMPVYACVGILLVVRLIVAYVLAQQTRNFGRGLKGFRLNIVRRTYVARGRCAHAARTLHRRCTGAAPPGLPLLTHWLTNSPSHLRSTRRAAVSCLRG